MEKDPLVIGATGHQPDASGRPQVVEEDLAPVEATSTLDALRAAIEEELASDAEPELLTLGVPLRPRFKLRFSVDFTYDQLVAWRTRAKDKSKPGGVHGVRYGCIILANQCVEIIFDDTVVTDGGEPVTFASRKLQEMFGATSASDAVRRMFVRDGYIDSAATRLVDEAGYGEEAMEDDTPRPTTD